MKLEAVENSERINSSRARSACTKVRLAFAELELDGACALTDVVLVFWLAFCTKKLVGSFLHWILTIQTKAKQERP